MKINKKAQATIEYLVIIAIVVVIALVVVGLLLQLMGQGSGIPQVAAQTTWKGDQPWALVDWSRTGTTLTLALKNNTSDSMDFVDMYVTSTNYNNTGSSNVIPGGQITKTITVASCTPGTKYSFPKSDIYIDFNTSILSGKRQNANADIAGTCS